MTEPRRVIAGRRTADEWENSVGFFGIGKKKWEEQAKAAQAEAEAQADDVKSALPNSDAEASDRTLAERVNEQQRWENSLRRFVQAESTRMQQEEQKSKDTSDLNVDALKQSAQHSGSSAEPSASTAGEARTSGSAEGKKTVGASSQAGNADAAQKGSFTQESAQTSDASAQKRAPQISEYRATSMPADAFETNSSATAVPSSNAASVSGTASVQTEAGSQKQNVRDALKEFNETKYGTEHEGNTSSVSSHADAAAAPSSSAEKESADIKTPNVEDREREKLAAGVVPTDADGKPAFVPAPGVESKNSNDKKTANADSTLESTPQESESASDVKASAHEKKSPSPEAQATSGVESTPSASKKSDKIEFVGSGVTGSAKHLDDRNDPETLAPEKNRSVETSAEKTSAEKMAVQHEKTVADEVSAHSSTDKDSKKQDVEKTARDEKASQNGAAAASSHAAAASVEGNEKAEVLTPENPLHDLVTAMRGYGSGKVSYELRQLGDDMHYRIFHRGSEVEQGVVVPTDAWFSSIASLYVRAQDAGRVWNRALVVANPGENGLVAVQASYTNTADASSYTTDYVLETSEKDSASQKDSSAKSAESAKSSADQSTASTDAADQKTSTAKTSALADSSDDTSSQKESEAKLAQDKSDEQAKAAEPQKAKDLENHTQDVKSADADKANTQDSQKSEKSEHTVDSEKKSSEAQDKAQEVSAKAQADTAKSDSATAESTKSGSSALAAGTLGTAAGVTAAGVAASSKSDREDSRYEYDYDADPQNVTGRHDAQAAEQSKTETDSAKAGAVSEKSEKSAVSGASAAKDSSDLSTPEAEAEKTKVEKSSEDEEELNSMQAALATIVASSEAKKTASNAKEDAADTSAAVKTSGTDSKSAADKTSEDSQKAAGSESTVKAESDAKTTAGYTSENQSANVTQAAVEESQAGTTSTDSSSALPKHVDDLALVPEVEKDSLTGSTDTKPKPQESASNKQDAPAAQTAYAVAAQSGESTVNGKTAQHESADLPPAEAEPDTPAHQAHSSVLAGDALAEGNLVLTDAKVIEHLAPVTEALFGENGSAKDATTVLIRVRSVGSYYDVLTHVRRNGFWEQVRTFELVSEEDLGIPTLKADSYSEGEGSPLAMSLTFTPGVPVQSAFDYSNEQAFVRYPRQLEADRYVEELRMFPRLGAKIPAHMANALTHWSM